MLKSDHFGIEITSLILFLLLLKKLKSDHFGIEILNGIIFVFLSPQLKSDHFGIEIINKNYLNVKFQELNQQIGGHTKGCYSLLRTHMLRKFHASNLARGENGLSLDEIDSLQGRTKDNVRKSYYFDDPKELRRKYVRNIDKVLINNESVKIDSPEVAALRKEAANLKKENEKIRNDIDNAVNKRISEVFSEYGVEEILKKHGL